MRISAVNTYSVLSNNNAYLKNNKNFVNQQVSLKEEPVDTVEFKGKAGKILGGILGAAGGGLAGGAIIGGGTLAGMAALALTGPVGLGLAIAYAVGGTAAGCYLGSTLGDVASDKKNDANGKKDNN